MDGGQLDGLISIALKVVPSWLVLQYGSKATSQPRLFSGVLTALVAGSITHACLAPIFATSRLPVATAALDFLAYAAAAVGMCFGVLLPLVFPGACFGAILAVLIGFFEPFFTVQYMMYIYPTLVVIGALVGLKCRPTMLMFASILAMGATMGSVLNPFLFSAITSISRGENFIPATSGKDYDYIPPAVSQLYLGLFWVVCSFISLIAVAYRQGGITPPSMETPAPTPKATRKPITEPPAYLQPAEPSLETFNMFNPSNLPSRLMEYANMVYTASEDLGNFFGFQDSSVRNQAEHILILLSNNRRYINDNILPPQSQPPSPIHALHAKVFSNYMKWTRSMGVKPHFARRSSAQSAPPAVASRVVDLVLFFCIWGEGCNIRHMPECLWFIYHKMMEEYIASEGNTEVRCLYDGHFLDNVVTPICDVVSKNMKSTNDHPGKCNYDDINEFFWSRSCLRHEYSSESLFEGADEESTYRLTGRLPGESLPSIVEGLQNAPKTFLEKRSWLRGVIALFRIFEWHLVTFYLLAVVAFSRELVWGWIYALQVASGVFWIFNSLQLTFGVLEVWAVYPGIQVSGTAVCGFVFALGTRLLILAYQTLYLMWAFGPSFDSTTNHFGLEEDSLFWWWQYIWLSLLCMLPWVFEVLMQIYPACSTKFYTSRNEYVQSFLNILFPLSRIYTGKEVHESFWHTVTYVLYWLSLMAWKLYFSYVFEVYSMVLPTLQITDDYINYSNQSFAKMSFLLTMRWMPQFLVYLIDMSIWYAVWQGFAGTAVGFSENLGDVKTMNDIRANFGRAPELFCQKMLSSDAGSRRGSMASMMSLASEGSMDGRQRSSESQALLGSDPHNLQSYVNRLLDVKIQKWVMFSEVWNEIIEHFRQEDIISNKERSNLMFSRFDGFSQAIYLPVFQTAGVMDDVITILESPREEHLTPVTDAVLFKPITSHVTMQTAVSEVWELGAYVLKQILGPIHDNDIVVITGFVLKWTEDGNLSTCVDIQNIRKAMNSLVQLITTLQKGIGRRKPATTLRKKRKNPESNTSKPIPGSMKPMRRVMSVGTLGSVEDEGARGNTVAPPKVLILDALRDQTRDKLRGFLQSMKSMLKSEESDRVGTSLTFIQSIENGFLWDDEYASDQLDGLARDSLFKEVLGKLHGLVACHPSDVEPKSKEARRRLTFFVNSLFMDMPDAPSIRDMFSFNVLTPYYSEDVMYNKADLEKRTDELGVSTLLYLQTLFHGDWQNFLERLKIDDPEKIWSDKFVQETRIWSSIRAQTLYRTVSGMMYYEKALRLLANLERLDDETTNDLMGEKFGYVVACQVYGNQKKNQDPKAEDIEYMMHKFPHLRIAYIDNIRVKRGASVYYSVLVKSDGNGGIEEVYRVRLPGNPVLGEGKPENQNHAMIFTRAEFVQTIDMNQEGYFEESLKMRNALQEFAKREGPLPTTILGLREHIFTASVSSLANYMALQETSFVTLGQRVLTKPLRIRLHYGHPDIFDKLFFITRGGISKSSKGINLSEDIFAGYNNAIRGGQVGFKEYLQVGKGRDVGMSQIYKFEAKLSQGAGEQSLSRDVYRLCHRLDFCRLLSYYYGGIGHYFSNVLTVLTIYCVVYLMAVLAIFDIEKIGDRTITPMGGIQMILGGLGLLQTIPLFATLGVERGWWNSLEEIFQVFVTGGPLHFMFHIQTKAHYMCQTILVGGAKYRATGRGFVTQHTPMDEQFRFFASSHLYLGVELAAGLIIMGIFTQAGQYAGRTWSLWLAATSFLASPFWFNPMSFSWNVVVSDYKLYLDWMGSTSGGSQKSWSQWFDEENAYYKKMRPDSKLVFIVKAVLYVLVANGIRTSDFLVANETLNRPWINVGVLVSFIVVFSALMIVYRSFSGSMPYAARQTIGIIIFVGITSGVFILFLEDSDAIRYSLAAYYGLGALCQIGLLYGFNAVKGFYYIHDLLCGHIIFVPLFILAGLQLPHHIQTWLLYHNALSADVVISNILRYAQKSQKSGSGSGSAEDGDLVDQVTELRKLVQKQQEMLEGIGYKTNDSSIKRNMSTDAISKLVSDDDETPQMMMPSMKIIRPAPATMGGRALSMSGLDVWGAMSGATGEDQYDSYQNQYPDPKYTSSDQSSGNQAFTFAQPDKMPPR